MKETIIPYTPNDRQISILRMDRDPYSTQEYRTNRVLAVNNFAGFDFFRHLWELADREPDRRLEVLEGGCGEGRALAQLKRGGKIDSKTEYKGLVQRIRTTGVTLYEGHLGRARQFDDNSRPDEMIVGPIEHYAFDRQFDFIYDFCGAAMRFPETVIPVYGNLLATDRLAFMRLMTGAMPQRQPEQLFEQSGFEIVKQNGSRFATMDFVVRKI